MNFRKGQGTRSSNEAETQECLVDQPMVVRGELVQAVTRLLADRQGVSPECFVAYHGIDGEPKRTLQEIGDEGEKYGFNRTVTRERVRQVLKKTESSLRESASRARFVRWQMAVEETRLLLPTSVHLFASRFGYESAEDPEYIFKMLNLCADILDLKFPFVLRTFSRLGAMIVDSDDDEGLSFISRLDEIAGGPYSELTEVSERIGCEKELLAKVIDASSCCEFLDDERRYYWKRPRLPPKNHGVTGNSVLTILCKVFSVTRHAMTTDLARSIVRDRILRKSGLASELPIRVLEGIADRSGLFDVGDGRISRKKGLEWCVIGQRDVALLKICVEHGRVVPSHLVYSYLLHSGLTQQNAAITVVHSPFLVHTQSGRGYKEGIYKFVVHADDIDLDALNARAVDDCDPQRDRGSRRCGRERSRSGIEIIPADTHLVANKVVRTVFCVGAGGTGWGMGCSG